MCGCGALTAKKTDRDNLKTIIFLLAVSLAIETSTAQAGNAFHGYGGVGLSVTDGRANDSKDIGFAVTAGLGRNFSRLGEVVLKGAYMWFGEKPTGYFGTPLKRRVGALGLYLKLNLRKERQRSFVYLLAGGGGLTINTWSSASSYYLGTGLGGVIRVENSRKLNFELRWIVPSSGGSTSNPFVLLTIGVAI